ncbi:anti-sigma factor [Silvimonas iriomotensis]|uniref:Membrane protein n=1 Tax=Silvimonas iriomotensis TaxID=449662 RepID=A0ABQ2PB37_9NEIS|nr:anti-sigma factor [Silvimonas iriomotensis]GGP22255.1 membrane protein [Silvimonas iriomotensis]
MKLNEALLMAWVDGELSAADADEVARLVAESPDAMATAQALAASRLPYAEAFASEAQPEVPASLRTSIHVLAQASRERAAPMPPLTGRQPARWQTARLASAFFAGALCALGGVHYWESAADSDGPWVNAVAQYQEMYVRDTLVNVQDDATLSARTLEDARTRDHLAVRIPDLNDLHFEFKRVQRLRYNDKPVIQMVYLPTSGDPVALCAAPDNRPDKNVQEKTDENQTMLTWRSNNVSYVLVGRAPPAVLRALSEQIRSSKRPPLYS